MKGLKNVIDRYEYRYRYRHRHRYRYRYLTMEFYSAFKKKEILSYSITSMKHEDFMLSEISQKDNYCMIPHT